MLGEEGLRPILPFYALDVIFRFLVLSPAALAENGSVAHQFPNVAAPEPPRGTVDTPLVL